MIETNHPILGSIVAEVRLIADTSDAALPDPRFRHWLDTLRTTYKGAEHADLYYQLAAMAFEFARRRCLAAVQLFTLATVGLPMAEAEKLAAKDGFLSTRMAFRTEVAPVLAPTAAQKGVTPPKAANSAVSRKRNAVVDKANRSSPTQPKPRIGK